MGRPEDKYVKIPALIHASRVGYTYMSLKGKEPDIDYDSSTNIFYEQFHLALINLNGESISFEEAKNLVEKLKHILSSDDLGKGFFEVLQKGIDGRKIIDLTLPSRNIFSVVTELPYANGDNSFRPDIVFLVNGMPLGFMEVKRPNNKEGIIAERERMYSRFSNSLYRTFVNITQVMAFSNNQEYDEDRQPIHGSYYASSAYGEVKLNRFREEATTEMDLLVSERDEGAEKRILADNNLASYFGKPEYESSVDPGTPANRIISSIFSPGRLLFFLRYGICYIEKTDSQGILRIEKHIMRYPQFFATKAVERFLSEGNKKGIIWHTQGSGKTALSYFLTRFLKDYYQQIGIVARFYFIVDRIDLATQAAAEFRSRGAHVVEIDSRDAFVKSMKSADDGNTGEFDHSITVVNIQKFSDDSTVQSFDYGLNIQRIFFLDEAHRDYKPGGSFLASLFSSDPSSVKIALTGTPLVSKKAGYNTKDVFGPYIHKYYYNQSIADGYTLKLLREEVEKGFRLKMQQTIQDLKELLQLKELKSEVSMSRVYEHRSYYEPLASYIIEDFKKSRIAMDDNSIGGMIVANTAPQARAMYSYLMANNTGLSIALVLHDEGSNETRKRIREDFKKGTIDILIVFNMLLTGFDAHRLKKLYLCRKISAHNLLQALTRVNRPYKDFAFGYVVDFEDISKEFDKTNQAYLRELQEELGDVSAEWSSLFEDPKVIESDLVKIKDTLWGFSISNVVEFQNEISAIAEKKELYELRFALKRYKELRNVAQMFGFESLYEQFDISRARELLNEVELRIESLNLQEALSRNDLSTGSINVLLDQMEFTFRKVGQQELSVADEFRNKVKGTYGSFGANIDPEDPEFVNLLDELKSKFEKVNIEELTTEEMVGLSFELDELKKKVDKLNFEDAKLQRQYGGDAKFARIHKKALRTPPPLTENRVELFRVLSRVKASTDTMVLKNNAILDQEDYFKKDVQKLVVQSCQTEKLHYAASQIKSIANVISAEYFAERRRAS